MTVRVEDNSAEYINSMENRIDLALGMMAQDIEMMAAFKVPTDTGALARYIKKFRVNNKRWKVTVNKDYAAYQERGMRADGTHRVENYSRAGSGPHFLEDAFNTVAGRKSFYLKRAMSMGGFKPTSGTDFG